MVCPAVVAVHLEIGRRERDAHEQLAVRGHLLLGDELGQVQRAHPPVRGARRLDELREAGEEGVVPAGNETYPREPDAVKAGSY